MLVKNKFVLSANCANLSSVHVIRPSYCAQIFLMSKLLIYLALMNNQWRVTRVTIRYQTVCRKCEELLMNNDSPEPTPPPPAAQPPAAQPPAAPPRLLMHSSSSSRGTLVDNTIRQSYWVWRLLCVLRNCTPRTGIWKRACSSLTVTAPSCAGWPRLRRSSVTWVLVQHVLLIVPHTKFRSNTDLCQ